MLKAKKICISMVRFSKYIFKLQSSLLPNFVRKRNDWNSK